MRPWVGLYDFEFVRDEAGKPRLFVLLRNVGPLPAQNVHLMVEVQPQARESVDEIIVSVRSEKFEDKSLMPLEDGNFGIRLDQYPQFETWVSARRDLTVEGTFTYGLGRRSFELKFETELWFSRPKPPQTWKDRLSRQKPTRNLVKTNWRNTLAG
jgi:hypothetical protein